MVWKFCGKVQFPHSFGRYFTQCMSALRKQMMMKMIIISVICAMPVVISALAVVSIGFEKCMC